jgi:hypothetical protein
MLHGQFALLFAAMLTVDRYLLPLSDTHYRQRRLRPSIVVIVKVLIAALTASQTVVQDDKTWMPANGFYATTHSKRPFAQDDRAG